jgi:probable HAF family extracellular repeat protein
VDLGRLPGDAYSSAQAVNSNGVAVGYSQSATPNAPTTAVMFSAGQVTNLNTLIPANSSWVLTEATGINDNGVIIGQGTLNGVSEGFTMTPPPPPPPPVGPITGLVSPIPVIGALLAAIIQAISGLLKINL